MPPTPCSLCHTARALVKRPKTGQQVCKECFYTVFETEVHNTIIQDGGLFERGEKVAIGASGGKGGSMMSLIAYSCSSVEVVDVQFVTSLLTVVAAE